MAGTQLCSGIVEFKSLVGVQDLDFIINTLKFSGLCGSRVHVLKLRKYIFHQMGHGFVLRPVVRGMSDNSWHVV